MLELFEEELKRRKREATLSTFELILLAVLVGVFFMALTSPVSIGLKTGLGMTAVVLFLGMHFWEKKREKDYETPWTFPARKGSPEEIAGWFSAEEIVPEVFFAFRGRLGISCRLLICVMDRFDSKMASHLRKKANKKINARYGVKAETSSWEAHRLLRTNLIVVPESSGEVVQWVNRTKITLTRAECVVNAAYIGKDGCLLVARPGYGFTLSELKRYEAAVRILLETLGEGEYATNG